MLIKRDFYINGRWTAPLAPRDYAVIDPSTEDSCAVISLGSDADTDVAVAAAKAAFPAWAATPPATRRDPSARSASPEATHASSRGTSAGSCEKSASICRMQS